MARQFLSLVLLGLVVSGLSCESAKQAVPEISKAGPVLSGDTSEGPKPAQKVIWTLNTTKGEIVIHLYPEWSPKGVERISALTSLGFYNDAAFFRVVPSFVVQFGMNGDPALHAQWSDNNLPDEPVLAKNRRGYVTFAKSDAPNSRSTQLFINLKDNPALDSKGFSPIGEVVKGFDIVKKINAQYGEDPDQNAIRRDGNKYLKSAFPKLDYIQKATVE